jgi:hypothetical protein
MTTAKVSPSDRDQLRDEWLDRLSALLELVQTWSQELGWSTRRIDMGLQDSEVGAYKAPALLLQMGAVKALLEPIARSAPGADGIVDLYIMPAYDDMASLYFYDGAWHVHYSFLGAGFAPNQQAASKPLTKETLQEVLDAMVKNAA